MDFICLKVPEKKKKREEDMQETEWGSKKNETWIL